MNLTKSNGLKSSTRAMGGLLNISAIKMKNPDGLLPYGMSFRLRYGSVTENVTQSVTLPVTQDVTLLVTQDVTLSVTQDVTAPVTHVVTDRGSPHGY